MVNYGADAIFTVGSNVNDKDIDAMIEDGLRRSATESKKAETKIGDKFNMTDFEMNTINLYDFEDEDYAKTRRENDALKMQEYVQEMVMKEIGPRQRRTVNYDVIPKIFTGKTVGISEETLKKKLQVV